MAKSNTIASLDLKPADLGPYETFSFPWDIRKDLHVFAEFVRNKRIKRAVRTNGIPKATAKQIARLLSDSDAAGEIDASGESEYLYFIDRFALDLGFVSYDTEGRYQGYTSYQLSYPDNYIRFQHQAYRRFLDSSAQVQEQFLFDKMVGKYSDSGNEFFGKSELGRLEGFDYSGCATGVVPGLKFDRIRRFLFDCLALCQAGVWYETSSLIQYLQKSHPFFLIPRNPSYAYKFESEKGRYQNFKERKGDEYRGKAVPEKAKDGFERVEGRYVERFLENIPLTLGYVDVAYGPSKTPGIEPSLGCLAAFRINERFLRFMNGEIGEPRVTIHPNHEIHVEAESYPAAVLERLAGFSDIVAEDRICIAKLNKKKAIEYMAQGDGRDLKKTLEDMAENGLPANIATELDEWTGHSDAFVLYEGFGLLEGKDVPAFAKKFEVENLSPSLRLIESPEVLFEELEEAEQAPVLVPHRRNALLQPPEGAKSLFKRKAPKAKKKPEKQHMAIRSKTYVTLFFQSAKLLEVFVKALVDEKCPVEVDRERKTASYASENKGRVDAAVKKLKKDYKVTIKNGRA